MKSKKQEKKIMNWQSEFDEDFLEDVKIHAATFCRTLIKQIEYWAKLGKISENLPVNELSQIKSLMISKEKNNIRNEKRINVYKDIKRDKYVSFYSDNASLWAFGDTEEKARKNLLKKESKKK